MIRGNMFAVRPKADISIMPRDMRCVPEPEVANSFNHLVCLGKHHRRDSEAERLESLDPTFEFLTPRYASVAFRRE